MKLNKEYKSETIVITNPSEKFIEFFKKMQAEKAKRKAELLKKDKYTFTIQV